MTGPRRAARARRGGALLATALLLAGCAGDAPAPDRATGRAGSAPASSEDWIARTDDDALFTVDCPFSHRAPDDPIVHPGQPGASHSHEFFGSTATDASSTGATLRGTETTCEDGDDTAAYWVPTLSVDGVPVAPSFVRAYYRARPGADVRAVTSPPLGLAMIAGDPDAVPGDHDHDGREGGGGATATTAPVPHEHGDAGMEHEHGGASTTTSPSTTGPVGAAGDADPPVAGWGCGLRPRHLAEVPPDDCTDRSPLTLQLRFPDCWDGENLDSPDHRAHVARSVDGACPATHPVLMTELQLSISWPVTGAAATTATLASGSTAGAHGDFLNGWEPDALAGHVDLCIHAKANCTIG